MSEQPDNKPDPKRNSWFDLRTIDDESNRDIFSAVSFKYFRILIASLFAIVLASPGTVSKTMLWDIVPLRSVVSQYLMVGFIGIMGYEMLAMVARRGKTQIKIPFIFMLFFGIYALFGFCLFLTLFNRLIGSDKFFP